MFRIWGLGFRVWGLGFRGATYDAMKRNVMSRSLWPLWRRRLSSAQKTVRATLKIAATTQD